MHLDRYSRMVRMAIMIILLGLGLWSSASAQKTAALPKEAQDAVNYGLDAARQQNWELALKYFSQVQKAAPVVPEVLFNLGLACDKSRGREVPAVAWYKAYLSLSPEAPNADQVRSRIMALKIKMETDISRLIGKIKEASPSVEAYLMNVDIDENSAMGALIKAIESSEGKGSPAARKARAEANQFLRERYTGEMYRYLTEAQIIMGDFSGAIETAGRSGILDSVYKGIAREQIRTGDLSGAEINVARITGNDKYFLLGMIASSRASMGDIEGAEKILTRIPQDRQREIGPASACAEITKAYAKAGQINQAEKTAAMIVNSVYTSSYIWSAYDAIIDAQLKARDIIGARKNAARLPATSHNSYTYLKIVEAQIKVGDLSGALKEIPTISDSGVKSSALLTLARKQAEAGDVPAVQKTLTLIEKDDYKPYGYTPLALSKLKAGDLPGARQAAELIEDKYQRAHAYCAMAEMQTKSGHLSSAHQSLDHAINLTGQIPDEEKKSNMWSLIATRHKENKDPAGARKALAQAYTGILKVEDNNWQKDHTLKRIYQLQQELGDKTGAQETEKAISCSKSRSRQIREANSWSHLAKNQLAQKALPDGQELSASLKGKSPNEMGTGLAKAAKDWAEAWAALRNEETESKIRSENRKD